MGYDSEGTTKVLYEPKTNYKIDRIAAVVLALLVVEIMPPLYQL
jgi:hypothetical protein